MLFSVTAVAVLLHTIAIIRIAAVPVIAAAVAAIAVAVVVVVAVVAVVVAVAAVAVVVVVAVVVAVVVVALLQIERMINPKMFFHCQPTLWLDMVELPVTVYEQYNQKGIAVVLTTIPLVIPFLISGLQLNHVRVPTEAITAKQQQQQQQ